MDGAQKPTGALQGQKQEVKPTPKSIGMPKPYTDTEQIQHEKHQEYRELLSKGEISLMLDTYDDIFSDFDPRPYHSRALSVDFLDEASRAAREKSGTLQIHFLLPAHERKYAIEGIIKKRLRAHFERHYHLLHKEAKQKIVNGLLISALGFILMIGAAYTFIHEDGQFLMILLGVILEPAGWFAVWEGMYIIFFSSRDNKQELEFYHKMTHADIRFDTY